MFKLRTNVWWRTRHQDIEQRCEQPKFLHQLWASPTPSPQGILHMALSVHFMQEATSSLPLILKYSSRQQLRQTNRTPWFRLAILGIFFTDRGAFLGLKINGDNSNPTPAIHSVELSQGDLAETLPFINLN